MGNYINKHTLVDGDTGEILQQKEYINYDGFSENGYAYRPRVSSVKFFSDSLPDNISCEAWTLLMMIAEVMNDDNVLIQRVKRKSKFSDIIYLPLTTDEIRERTRFVYGKNKFFRCWYQLRKHCIKKVKYHDTTCWCVNPAVVMKSKYIPIWLYAEFYQYLDPHISSTSLKKIKAKLEELQEEEINTAIVTRGNKNIYGRNLYKI